MIFFRPASSLLEEYDYTVITPIPKRKKMNPHSLENNDGEIAKLLKESISQRDTHEKCLEDDDDRHFLLSLLGDFKRLPIEKKLDVKIEVIRAIRAAIKPI